MPADYSRIHRLLKILTLIQGQAGWTATRLSVECGVTERTIFRDLKMLEGAGIPFFHDPDSAGYRVRGDFFLPPTDLSLDEALALIALGEHVGNQEQVPLTRPAGRAIQKIRGQLPGKLRRELERLEPHVAVHLARSGPHEGIADVYEAVREAIRTRRRLRCRYESVRAMQGQDDNGGANDWFEFFPYTLLFSQRAWYAVGHHGGRDAVRKLKLNRFAALEATDRPYAIPDDFDLGDHLGLAWRMIRGEPRCEVELTFEACFAETLADTYWHPTQVIDWHDDGSITFRCTVDGLDEIVWWVLSMGPHCRVIQPPGLVERVADLARRTAEQYSEQKPSAG